MNVEEACDKLVDNAVYALCLKVKMGGWWGVVKNEPLQSVRAICGAAIGAVALPGLPSGGLFPLSNSLAHH